MVRIFERYLDDIGREPLLTAEEEARLAVRSRRGDEAARRRLVTANLRFVVSVARRYQGRGVPLVDLVNEGNVGLLKAADRFDPGRGVRFISYAHFWVRRAIQRHIALQDGTAGDGARIRRVSIDEPLGRRVPALRDILPDANSEPPERAVLLDDLRGAVEAGLADLPARERRILRRYFGLDGCPGASLEVIAKELGVTRERARQMKERGLARMRAAAGRHRLSAHAEDGVMPD